MNSSQTLDKLSRMKLYGFIEALDEQRISSQYSDLCFDERLTFLVDREFLRRENNKMKRRLSMAQLKQKGTFEDIRYCAQRGFKKTQIAELAQCSWINEHQNLIITGATGVGKTFIACALADTACKKGFSSLYIKTSELMSQLKFAEAEGTLQKLLIKFMKTKLLIIDEWLREPVTAQKSRLLLDLLDDRYETSSTIFVAQLPVNNWHSQIEDQTIADALLDRIVHNSHRLKVEGESQRKLNKTTKSTGSTTSFRSF